MHFTRKLPFTWLLLPVLLALTARGYDHIAAAISQQPPAIDIATGSEIPSEGYCDQPYVVKLPEDTTESLEISACFHGCGMKWRSCGAGGYSGAIAAAARTGNGSKAC